MRNASGSAPAATASSSMKLWFTNASALEPGARIGPVGTPSEMVDWSILQFPTKRLGNSLAPMPALEARVAPSPKVTKWSCQATTLPSLSTPPLK